MNSRKYLLFFVGSLVALIAGCQENVRYEPSESGPTPAPVSNVNVENRPGGAKITYDLPENKNLLYVKGDFLISEENKREAKVSYFDNKIIVEGFPDTSEYTGKLYTISRTGKQSKPAIVHIKPLTPPVEEAFKTVSMHTAFGGVRVDFQNESEANLVFTVLAEDSTHSGMITAKKNYTKNREGTFYARGFPHENRAFAVFVEDNWGNRSDTISTSLVPYEEQKLDKSNFEPVHLPTDTYEQHCCGSGMTDLWDDKYNDPVNTLHTKPGTGMPQWFTFDLGVKAQLDRFKLYSRANRFGNINPYNAGDPKKFEIWGSNNPNPNGSWQGWTKLGTFTDVKPSGSGPVTKSDIQYAVMEGKDFQFKDPTKLPEVRYLRFKTIKTWGGLSYMFMSELTFFGRTESE